MANTTKATNYVPSFEDTEPIVPSYDETVPVEDTAPVNPRAGMRFTPDDSGVERGRRLIENNKIGALGTVGRGFAESQFLGKGEEVIGLAKGAKSAVTGKGPDTLESIQQEKDIQSAMREDSPLEFAVGEMAGLVAGLPANIMKAGGRAALKGAVAGWEAAVPIVSKIYPAITSKPILVQMAKAFIAGGAELGLFEGIKETLESGSAKNVIKKTASGAIAGGVGGAVATGLISPFTKSQAEKAIEKGMQIQAIEKKAGKEGDKAVKLTREMLNEENPQVIGAILKDPKSIQRLVNNGPVDDFTLGQRLQKEVSNLKSSLVNTVGKMKKSVSKDTSKTIDTGFFLRSMEAVEKKLTTTDGKTVLTGSDIGEFRKIKDLLSTDKISASDALLIVDKIDGMVNWSQREASNISEQAARGLKLVRKALKTKLHVRYPQYSLADDNLSQFLDISGKIEQGVGNNSEQFVRNLFGANKTQLRNDLIKMRGLASRIDPKSSERTLRLAQDISSAKAAQVIKSGMLPPPGRRTLQEISNKTIDKYATYGATAGASIGTYIGSIVGGFTGAGVGAAAGATGGRMIGRKIGESVGNPMRILNAAIKSKQLSARAKLLAKEIQNVTIEQGVDGFSKMMDVMPSSVKGAQELGRFILNNSSIKTTDILDDEEIRTSSVRGQVNKIVEGSLDTND